MVAAVGLEDPLHDDLAPLVLEVDVDVRRLAALLRDEALEQQVVALGIDGGDAEHIADGAVGGRAAALAEDVLAAGEADDGIHGQKIRRVLQRLDQPQFVLEDADDLVWHAFGIARVAPSQVSFSSACCGVMPGIVGFLGILIRQLVQRKPAALGDLERAGQRLGIAAEQPRHLVGRLSDSGRHAARAGSRLRRSCSCAGYR